MDRPIFPRLVIETALVMHYKGLNDAIEREAYVNAVVDALITRYAGNGRYELQMNVEIDERLVSGAYTARTTYEAFDFDDRLGGVVEDVETIARTTYLAGEHWRHNRT